MVPPDSTAPCCEPPLPEVRIAAPLAHQRAVDASHARYKVVRAGRRYGKTSWGFKGAMVGHGPGQPDTPTFRAVAQGFEVYWIGPDYPQTSTLWHTEILTRFEGVEGISVNNSEFDVRFPNGGALLVRSAENIRAVRGSGKRLGGVVLEEAAHWDLERGWREHIRPALMDCEGWAVFISTTNGGSDGHVDEAGNKVTPSFFNRICQEIRDGRRGAEWAEFQGDARDNPKISPSEFAALVAEYPADSVDLQQEVYAALVEGGVGKVFTEWRADLHVVDWDMLPPGWIIGGASLDPGYRDPLSFGLWAMGPEGDVVRWDELYQASLFAEDAGRLAAHKLVAWRAQVPTIACDIDLFKQTGVGPTAFEKFQAGLDSVFGQGMGPRLVGVAKGPGSRKDGLDLMHQWLSWTQGPDGTVPPWGLPRLRAHRRCANWIRTMPALPYGTAAGSRTDVDTHAEDHGYDDARYFISGRPIPPRVAHVPATSEDAETARRWQRRFEKLAAHGAPPPSRPDPTRLTPVNV